MFTHYLEESRNASIPYINRIIDNLKNNLLESSNKNNERAFLEILLFFRGQAFDSLRNSSLVYTQMTSIPADIYPNLSKEYKRKLIEIFTIRFHESISYINFYEKYEVKYLEISYWGFLKLIKKTIDENDYENFNLIFEKIRETGSSNFDKRGDTQYYHHSFAFSLISWIFYLHQNNIINYDDYNMSYLEEILQHDLYNNKEKIINNFYRFEQEATLGLFEIDNWEIKKGPIGIAYFVLMSHTWLNFGFLIMLLKYDILNYGIKIEGINLNDKFKYIVDDIKANLSLINNNSEKWYPIIMDNLDQNMSFNERYNLKKEKIIDFYNELNKRQEILKYTTISKIPLSSLKIEEFKQKVGSLWDKNSFIPTVLKFYERVNYKKNIKDKLGLGYFQNLLKMRFAFIEGEHYQSVYGLTNFGAKTAHSVNEFFFIELLKEKDPIITINLRNEIDTFLSNRIDYSKVVIFSNWRGNQMLNNNENVVQYNEDKLIPFSNAKYKETPIIANPAYPNLVFLIDLNYIEYDIYENENWYNKELLIEVSEPKFEDIDDTSENEGNWREIDGIVYSKEEIATLEKNAIHLKVIFKFDLNILDKEAFEIYKLSE